MVRTHHLWFQLLLLLETTIINFAKFLIVVIIKTTDDEISPSLHSRIDLINTDTLSEENLMMAGIGRNM